MIQQLALDTNAYRAYVDGDQDVRQLVRSAEQIGLPVVVLGELYHGIYLGGRQDANLQHLNRFLETLRVTILGADETTAKIFGEIATELRRAGRPIQQNDMWIAALCKQYNFVLATRDADFARVIGLELARF